MGGRLRPVQPVRRSADLGGGRRGAVRRQRSAPAGGVRNSCCELASPPRGDASRRSRPQTESQSLMPPSEEVAMTSTVPESATEIRPFRIEVPEEELTDLRRRIAATRWPEQETV